MTASFSVPASAASAANINMSCRSARRRWHGSITVRCVLARPVRPARYSIGTIGSSGHGSRMSSSTIRRCRSRHVQQTIQHGRRVEWRNTPSALLGAIPNYLFYADKHARGGEVECIGVDLSAAGVRQDHRRGCAVRPSGSQFRFVDCKLDASVTKSAVPIAHGAPEIDFVRSGSAGVNYTVLRHRVSGTARSRKPPSSAPAAPPMAPRRSPGRSSPRRTASYSMPFECPPIAIWNDTTGSAVTATVEGIWGGGAVPMDDEIWLECRISRRCLLAAGFVRQRRQGRSAGDRRQPDLQLGNLGRLDHQVQARRDIHAAAKGLGLCAGEMRARHPARSTSIRLSR